MEALSDGDIVDRLLALAGEIQARGAAQGPGDTTLPAAPAEPTPAPALAPLAWGAKVSPQFRDFVRQMAVDFAPAQPSWFMACMAFETGRTFSPKVRNPHSSATGLIQFMDATALELKTTTAALAAMTPEHQLEFVWLYFRNRIRQHGPIARLSDCYMAILNPVAMGQDDGMVMWVSGQRAYAVNAGLDANQDHQITKAEAAARVAAMLAEGLQPENVG